MRAFLYMHTWQNFNYTIYCFEKYREINVCDADP